MCCDALLPAPCCQILDAWRRFAGRYRTRAILSSHGFAVPLLGCMQIFRVRGEHHLQCFR